MNISVSQGYAASTFKVERLDQSLTLHLWHVSAHLYIYIYIKQKSMTTI